MDDIQIAGGIYQALVIWGSYWGGKTEHLVRERQFSSRAEGISAAAQCCTIGETRQEILVCGRLQALSAFRKYRFDSCRVRHFLKETSSDVKGGSSRHCVLMRITPYGPNSMREILLTLSPGVSNKSGVLIKSEKLRSLR